MNPSKTIAATLGDKLLSNAASFFRNDPASVMDEVVQNARRAGATRVDFEVDGQDLLVTDDGTGLAYEDADVLLALGRSALGGGVERDEAAAGIGFFALAHHVVHVRTQDWRCTIRPEHFVGTGDAVVEGGLPDVYGMRLRIEGMGRVENLRELLGTAMAYSGLRGRYANGGDVVDFVSYPFLDAFNDSPEYSGSRIVALPGARLRVVRYADLKPGKPALEPVFLFNFFGKVIEPDTGLGNLSVPFPNLDVHATPTGGKIVVTRTRTTVLVDVQTTATVRLRLPDRDAVVDETGLRVLAVAATSLLREMLADGSVPHGIASFLMGGLAAPCLPLTSLGIDPASLVTRPSPDRPAVSEVVDSDGLPVDPGSLVACFNDALIDEYVPHSLKLTDGRIVRVMDVYHTVAAGLRLPLIDAVALTFDRPGETRVVSLEPCEALDMLQSAYHQIDEVLPTGKGRAAACRCDGISLVVDVEGIPSVPLRLDFFVAGDIEVEGPESAVVLATGRVDPLYLAERAMGLAEELAVDLMYGDYGMDDEFVEAAISAWRMAALTVAPDDQSMLTVIAEEMGDLFARMHLLGSKLDLRVSVRPGKSRLVEVSFDRTTKPKARKPRKPATDGKRPGTGRTVRGKAAS